jgi:hypothetical protein
MSEILPRNTAGFPSQPGVVFAQLITHHTAAMTKHCVGLAAILLSVLPREREYFLPGFPLNRLAGH